MSGLGRAIFSHVVNNFSRSVRGYEKVGGQILANLQIARRYFFYGGVAFCSIPLTAHYLVELTSAQGVSMYPTMPEKTPYTLCSNLHAYGKNVSIGDIVNFASPIFLDQRAGKRVIGMPGDYIVLDAHQAPSVGNAPVPGITDWRSRKEIEDGVKLKEREEPVMIEVPEGHMYVVGDNMSWSRDSRYYGAVPLALVHSKQMLHGGFRQGWNWTGGEQMTRIPKEEEEEYLRRWKRRRDMDGDGAKIALDTTSKVTEKID